MALPLVQGRRHRGWARSRPPHFSTRSRPSQWPSRAPAFALWCAADELNPNAAHARRVPMMPGAGSFALSVPQAALQAGRQAWASVRYQPWLHIPATAVFFLAGAVHMALVNRIDCRRTRRGRRAPPISPRASTENPNLGLAGSLHSPGVHYHPDAAADGLSLQTPSTSAGRARGNGARAVAAAPWNGGTAFPLPRPSSGCVPPCWWRLSSPPALSCLRTSSRLGGRSKYCSRAWSTLRPPRCFCTCCRFMA